MAWEVPNVADDYPQIMENHIAYNEIRQEIEAKHFGQVALMHNKQIVGFFDTRGDAYAIGCEKYGLGNFILKTVGEKPISIGIHALFS